MARKIINTISFSDTTTAVQVNTEDVRLLSAAFKARDTNNGAIYLGDDSNVSSTAAWKLAANEFFSETFDEGTKHKTIISNTYWVIPTDASDLLDYSLTLEQ